MELRTQTGQIRAFDIDVTWTTDDDPPVLQTLLRDTTEEKSILRELRDANTKLTMAFALLPAAVAVVERDTFVSANKALAVLFGYQDAMEVVGRSFSSHVSAKFRTAIADHHRRIIEGRLPDSKIEFHALRKGHSAFPVEEIASFLEFNGQHSLLLVLRDVTPLHEQKKRGAIELDEWRNLDEILRGVRHTLDMTDTCRGMLEHVLHILSFDFGMLYLPDAKGTHMNAATEINVPVRMLDSLRQQPAREGVVGWVIKTEEPFSAPIDEYPPHLPYRSLFETSGVKRIAYVPLRGYGSVHAVLMLGSSRSRTQPEHELQVLKHLTDHLGAHIVSAQRYTTLKEHTAALETIISRIPHILYQCSASGAYTYISPTVREFVGYTPPDFYRNTDLWRNLIHPDDRPVFGHRVTGHMQARETLKLEYRILPKGKAAYHWLQDEIHYLRDSAGAVIGFTGSITDISGEKHKKTLANYANEALQILASRALSCYAVVDQHLCYFLWDDCLERSTGIQREDVLYRRADSATGHLMPPRVINLVTQSLNGTTVVVEEELAWSRFETLRKESGEILGVLCVFRNREHT